MMKLLITGARGFIGKNLCARLEHIRSGGEPAPAFGRDITVLTYDKGMDPALLDSYCAQADFVFHLAGVNCPDNPQEFMTGNRDFTAALLRLLRRHDSRAPILFSSSVQAALDNPYGQSKKAAEDLIFSHGEQTGARVLIYRFPNVFGRWSRPNYNSVVATFCYNISRDLPIRISDPNRWITLVYIDDLIDELLRAVSGEETRDDTFCRVPVSQPITLGALAELLYSFRRSTDSPIFQTPLEEKLYRTWLSYLPSDSSGGGQGKMPAGR